MIQASGTPPRISLIGVSGYAEIYIDWLLKAHQAGKIRIAAATILPHERNLPSAVALQEVSPRIYESYQSMFDAEAGKLDISFIPTGIQWHAPMTIAALKAGSNVLVEKPLAGSVTDVEKLQTAEIESGKWIAVGFQDMYTAELLQLKQKLVDGVIGSIESVSMIGAWPRPASYYTRNHWAGKLVIDGQSVFDSPLNNAFAHFVNLSLFLAGPDANQSADARVTSAELYNAHEIESFDTGVVKATSASGVNFWFGVTHSCTETIEPRIQINGSLGRVVWEHEQDCVLFHRDRPSVKTVVPRYAQTRQNMFESVIKRLHDKSIPICDTQIAKAHTQLIGSLHQRARIRSVIPELIEKIPKEGPDAYVPAIKNIASRLREAFQCQGELGDLNAHPQRA